MSTHSYYQQQQLRTPHLLHLDIHARSLGVGRQWVKQPADCHTRGGWAAGATRH